MRTCGRCLAQNPAHGRPSRITGCPSPCLIACHIRANISSWGAYTVSRSLRLLKKKISLFPQTSVSIKKVIDIQPDFHITQWQDKNEDPWLPYLEAKYYQKPWGWNLKGSRRHKAPIQNKNVLYSYYTKYHHIYYTNSFFSL